MEAVAGSHRVLLGVPGPRGRGQFTIALLGAGAVTAVAYASAHNPQASPQHGAVILRTGIIAALIATGLYARTHKIQARMGSVLLAAGFFSAAWLLNGSGDQLLFGVGVICTGLAPIVFAYVMLAYPGGRLVSRAEQSCLLALGGALTLVWTYLVLTEPQPPFRTPLLQCVPHCPHSASYLGSPIASAVPALKALATLSWTAVVCATPLFLSRRLRAVSAPARRALIPVALVALVNALLWVVFLVGRAGGATWIGDVGAAYVAMALAVPLAILMGLVLERLFLASALAEFTTALMQNPGTDPAVMMARALGDPTLTIVYELPGPGSHVDFSGAEAVVAEDDADRAVAWIERDGRRIAGVIYDAELAAQSHYVQAAGAAVMTFLAAAQLEADLMASDRALRASRIRLVEAADAERQRIERDIHDGVQQQLVGLRLKVALASEAIDGDSDQAKEMIATIGSQLEDVITTLRTLARGIYPPLLTERGLADALRSTALSAPVAISVRARGLKRHTKDIEMAVYFCCLEAIQNVVKHAGPSAQAVIRLSEENWRLRFEITDNGAGFDPDAVYPGSGLVNMRDRVESVGGTLSISSRRTQGTSIRGEVELAPPPEPR